MSNSHLSVTIEIHTDDGQTHHYFKATDKDRDRIVFGYHPPDQVMIHEFAHNSIENKDYWLRTWSKKPVYLLLENIWSPSGLSIIGRILRATCETKSEAYPLSLRNNWSIEYVNWPNHTSLR